MSELAPRDLPGELEKEVVAADENSEIPSDYIEPRGGSSYFHREKGISSPFLFIVKPKDIPTDGREDTASQ